MTLIKTAGEIVGGLLIIGGLLIGTGTNFPREPSYLGGSFVRSTKVPCRGYLTQIWKYKKRVRGSSIYQLMQEEGAKGF